MQIHRSSRRQHGGATLKIVGVVVLLAALAFAWKAWSFYQEKVAPVVDTVAQATAIVAGAAQVMEKLNPFEISRDPVAIAETLKATFRIAPPPGYVGAFDFNVVMLGQPQSRMVAMIPQGVAATTIFEGGRNEIRFNPGKATIFLAMQYPQSEQEEIQEAIERLAKGDGESPALEPVFIEAGGRKVAALRGETKSYGSTNTVVYTFLDDGRVFFATGPRDDFNDAALESALGSLVATHPANTLLYEHPKPEVPQPPSSDPCGIPGLGDEFDVVLISVYKGTTPLDIAIDTQGHDVTQEDVIVGRTEKPVVLVLAGYDPIVWNIGQTADARIAGVLAQGVHRQAVIGLPKSTLMTTYSQADGSNACRYFRAEGDVADISTKKRVRELFGRRIGTFINRKAGPQFAIGEIQGDAVYSQDVTLKSVALPDNVMPGGQKGIDRLVKQQSLREATAEEIDNWVVGAARAGGRPLPEYRERIKWRLDSGVYVVLRPLDLPDGLAGAHARAFILPVGTAMPGGPQGHNTFLLLDGFKCEGTACP